jgi:hypothetical protein
MTRLPGVVLLALACPSGLLFAGTDIVAHPTATTHAHTITAPVDPNVVVASPDHPGTWWSNPFDKRSQYLEWKEGALNGRVVYASPSYLDSWNPVLYDSFKVSFPDVHFDAANNRLYYRGPHHREVTVGHLEPGVFGSRVVLEKGIDFSANRNHGQLDAALVKSAD